MSNNFTDEVTKHIKNKTAKQLIEAELSSHILDRIDYYVELGYTKEQAEEKTAEDMGDPEQTALPLSSLHNIRWYKRLENWITIALLLGELLIAVFFGRRFLYGNSQFNIIHYITIDFASFLLFVIIVLLIHIARKRKNKFMLISVCIYLFLQLFTPIYKPMFYGIAEIFSHFSSGYNGFSAYTDIIFSYSYTPSYLDGFLTRVSQLMVGFTILYCILVLLGIFLQERILTKKNFWKPYKIAERIAVCLLAMNFAVMAVFTTIAYVNLDTKIEENQRLRKEEIDFILNTDVSKKASDLAYDFHMAGYFPLYREYEEGFEFDFQHYTEDNTQMTIVSYKDKTSSISYYVTTSPYDFCPLDKTMKTSAKIFDEFKESMTLLDYQENTDKSFPTEYISNENILSLQEFLSIDFYTNAYLVEKNGTHTDEDNNEQTIIRFSFLLEDSQYRLIQMIFTDNYLYELLFWY